MNIPWNEVTHTLVVWSAYVALYGVIALSVITLVLILHTKVTKDNSCNIKLLRKFYHSNS